MNYLRQIRTVVLLHAPSIALVAVVATVSATESLL